jgi:hypothetical protein
MNNTRLKQFGISFLVVLSLFVSSISACACSHHQLEKVEAETPSCHQHSEMAMAENHHQTDSAEIFQTVISEGGCCCIQPAPKVVSKNESFKLNKSVAALLTESQIEIKPISQIVSVAAIDFVTPFYLSDSFYNLTPSRGPPRL